MRKQKRGRMEDGALRRRNEQCGERSNVEEVAMSIIPEESGSSKGGKNSIILYNFHLLT